MADTGTERKKVRLVVSMFAGSIQQIMKDDPGTDMEIIFTEYPKYAVDNELPYPEVKDEAGDEPVCIVSYQGAVDNAPEYVKKVFDTANEALQDDDNCVHGMRSPC